MFNFLEIRAKQLETNIARAKIIQEEAQENLDLLLMPITYNSPAEFQEKQKQKNQRKKKYFSKQLREIQKVEQKLIKADLLSENPLPKIIESKYNDFKEENQLSEDYEENSEKSD